MTVKSPSRAPSINQVLANNLARHMEDKELTQMALAGKAKMGQTTVSLYLNPDRRTPGKSGKEPSAKLAEVQRLADALGTELWQLLRPPGDPASSLSRAAQELAQAFDAVPHGDEKVRLYAQLLNEIRLATPSATNPVPQPGAQPILSQTHAPGTARGRSRVGP